MLPYSLFFRPSIIVGSSAKLLTSFVAALASYFTRSKFFLDYRDTFADNFFYFYRWRKRIILQSIIMVVENIVIRLSYSVNMVSPGFEEAFVGLEKILSKYSIKLTNYTTVSRPHS